MTPNIKKRLLSAISTVVQLSDYDENDCIFSQKYGIVPVAMVYILKKLAEDFRFDITDDFVDSLENCTFVQLEALLEKYSGMRNLNQNAG